MTELFPAVTVTLADYDAAFVSTFPRTSVRPVVLDADNLSDAQRHSLRLRVDADHGRPLPLLRIDVAPDADFGTDAIPFAQPARRVAGLIADAARIGIAFGAVIVGAEAGFDADVAEQLRESGFRVQHDVSGWSFDDCLLAATS